ncbi:hypothetical protein Y032_0213g2312 [Ancylostoma ceylanicum]|uniref:Uncharacterized protein n=1 Tax=Ancylostoma ceylanicum TaxID=53326 RepID=A0A016SJJ7_9BILA|nr:hypothetical protein Y032_0213g2312 [Ancylostoma ceylanicum]
MQACKPSANIPHGLLPYISPESSASEPAVLLKRVLQCGRGEVFGWPLALCVMYCLNPGRARERPDLIAHPDLLFQKSNIRKPSHLATPRLQYLICLQVVMMSVS